MLKSLSLFPGGRHMWAYGGNITFSVDPSCGDDLSA